MALYNVTDETSFGADMYGFFDSTGDANRRNLTAEVNRYESLQDVKRAMRYGVIPTICVIGIVGNVANLVVLTRVRLRKVDRGQDSGIHLGLIALAISDLLFCLTMFPRQFVPETRSLFDHRNFWCLYQVYGSGIVTTFILTSTWITVVMAMLRYMGICHPFCSRRFDLAFVAKVAYILVFLCCFLFNLPSFRLYTLTEMDIENQTHHLVDIGYFDHKTTRGYVFIWCRMLFGVLLPVTILVFCNASLIRALRRSLRMRRRYHVHETVGSASSRITLTLIIIIMVFVTLVVPSEAMDFFSDLIRLDVARTEVFLFVRAFANVLQMANFALNFILYVSVNSHFRNVLADLLPCSQHPGQMRIEEPVEYPLVNLLPPSRLSTNSSYLDETKARRLTPLPTSSRIECHDY